MTELFAIFAAKKRLKRYGAVQTTRMNANEVKEKWLNIQKRSYTNWINEVLRPTGVVVNDIVDDIGSGVLLCKLAMLLTMKKIKYQRNPKMVFQRQENIQKALILIEQSGCKLIGIGASDILTKNEKLILGLMWQLIQHFHVFQSIKNVEKMKQQLKSEQLMGNARDGETDEIYDNDLKSSDKQKKSSAIKRQILADLNKRLAKRGVEVDNLTKDWKDGEALCALVDYNVRGIYDLYLDSDPVQKVAQSMIAAYKFLGIPQLIEPEDFISNLIDEQTMSMYLSCFVHDGIEEISVDLFEGIKKEEEKVQTVEEIVKKNHVLVKQESVLSMPITPASAVVLDFIQVEPTIRKSNENDLQEEEEKASPGRFKAANQHVTKIISSLPDHSPSRQSSLSEILAPQVRSNSDSSVDEGIGPDILADVSASLQSTPSKGDPDPEKNISSEDVIAKVSLEDSLPASEPVETVSTEPADVADVIEQEIQAVNVTPEVIPVESSALSISDPECSSPGEIELVSEDNQEDIRQKLENEIAASISAEMSSIRNKDDSERLDSSEEKGDETSLSDVENRTGGWGQEGAIITTSLEQVISQEEPEVTDRDLSTPEPLDDEEGETPTIESEKSILEVDLKAIEPSADPVDLTIETEEPIVSEITDEVKVTSEIEVKEPVVNVEATVEVPKIELNTSEEVEDTSTEIAATALEVAASGTLAEAALEAASTPTVDVDVKTSAPEFDIHTDEEPEVPAEVPDLETPEVAISTEAVAPDVPEVTISTEVVAPEVPEVDIPTEAVAPEVPEVAISTEVAAPEVPEVNISTELVAPEVPEVTIPTEVEAPEVPEVTISTEVAAPEVPEVAISTEVVAPDVPEVDISTEVAAPEVPEVGISTEVVAPAVPEVNIPTEVVAPDVPEVNISTEVVPPDVPGMAISAEVAAPEVPEVNISTEVAAPEVPEVAISTEVVAPDVPAAAAISITTDLEVDVPEVETQVSAGLSEPDTVAAVIELPTLTSGFDESSDVEISAGTEPSSDIEVTIPKDDNVAKVSEPEISTKIATESQGVDVDIPMAVISTKVETETVEVGIPASDISKEDTDVDEKVKTPKVEGAADITVSGGDTENEIESLPSIDASFIRDIEFNSDGEMIVPSSTDEPISIEKPIATVEPTLTDEPIYSVSTKQKIPPLVDSEVSVPEKRISVAASSGSSTTKSTKSLRGSIISGGDEISVSKIDKQFPAIDSRLLLLLASMDTTSQEYEAAKEQFRKFIAKSDIDYRSVSFLKCCQLMRASLLAAQFKIVGAGENVMFDDLPFKPKRGFTTLTLKKKKSSKKLEDIDPLLAQLPKSASLKKSHTADQPLSKKQMQRQKELGNASISLYTEVVQCYQNYKTMMQTAQSWQGSQLEASYGDCMDTMQDEVMMGNMILTGLCSPD
ncbi:hypothetical protein ACHWQZ_G015441 [Mnemiopsis leidyi]